MTPMRACLVTAAIVCAAAAIHPVPGNADHRDEVRVRRHDDDWKKAKHGKYGKIRYVTVRHRRAFVLRPAREDCFVVRRHRTIVVRPVPYWSVPYRPAVSAGIGVRTNQLQFDLAFNDRRPYYGCNFCEAYFPSYVVWKRHVLICSHRPPVRVICEAWDEDDLEYFSESAIHACSKFDDDWEDEDEEEDDDD